MNYVLLGTTEIHFSIFSLPSPYHRRTFAEAGWLLPSVVVVAAERECRANKCVGKFRRDQIKVYQNQINLVYVPALTRSLSLSRPHTPSVGVNSLPLCLMLLLLLPLATVYIHTPY
jgi:hypothetical protein